MTCAACARKQRAQSGELPRGEQAPPHTCGLVEGALRKGKGPVHLVNMGTDEVVLLVKSGKTACGRFAEECYDAEPGVVTCGACALVALSWRGPYWQRAVEARAKGRV